jgi:D-arabinose 5-phosphate isomerase GutQ
MEKVHVMADRTVGRSFGNLILALLNATLILTALCLWLSWKAFSAVEGVSGNLENAAEKVVPLRSDVAALTTEIASLRAAIADRGAAATAADAAMTAQLARIEDQLAEISSGVTEFATQQEDTLQTLVETAFAGLGVSLGASLKDAFERVRAARGEQG